jgi:hypothetical protein
MGIMDIIALFITQEILHIYLYDEFVFVRLAIAFSLRRPHRPCGWSTKGHLQWLQE